MRRQNLIHLPAPITEILNRLRGLGSQHRFRVPASRWGWLGLAAVPTAGHHAVRWAPAACCIFWQAALSKARPLISAYLPSIRVSLWLTLSPHCLPKPHGESLGGDKGHEGTCWEEAQPGKAPSPQDSLTPSTAGAGARAGGAACL